MIFFVPGYDAPTQANLAIARQLAPSSAAGLPLCLLGATAKRPALANALASPSIPIFAMSHGRHDRLFGHGGEPAIEESDEHLLVLLGQRVLFAYACHTATSLGKVASGHGVTWWGYTGKVQSPVEALPFAPIFVELFQFILDRFWSLANYDARAAFLDELKNCCELAAGKIDEFGDAHPDADTFSAQLCARHTWDRLRIWVKGASGPEHHPQACPPALMLD